jgi:DNA-binding MarR family transcriptional regulator
MKERSEYVDCQNCLCLDARREAQRLTRAYDERLRPFGLTINQFSMLSTLILAGSLPVSNLAVRLGIDRTTLTRNIAVGETNGIVATRPGKDARTRLVEITPAGRVLADEALPAWRMAQAKAIAGKPSIEPA